MSYGPLLTVTRIANTASTFPHGPGGPSLPSLSPHALMSMTLQGAMGFVHRGSASSVLWKV